MNLKTTYMNVLMMWGGLPLIVVAILALVTIVLYVNVTSLVRKGKKGKVIKKEKRTYYYKAS